MRDVQFCCPENRTRFLSLLVAVGVTVLAATAAGQVMDPAHPREAVPSSHVNTSLACAECHQCDNPTADDPCMGTCPRHKDSFVGTHKLEEGPEVVVIDQLSKLYEPVVFAHRLHAQMSAMTGGCENCHHYSEQSGTIPPCRDCHDPAPAAMDLRQPSLKGAYHRQCINCHLDWSHDNACEFCHAESGANHVTAKPDKTDLLGVRHPQIEATPFYTYKTSYAKGPVVTFHHNDHVEKFGLKCVDCHRGESCSRCHDNLKGTATTVPVRKVDHVTTCGACHAERNCDFCHSQQEEPAFHHAESAKFSLTPFHAKVACNTCHGEPKAFRTPSPRCTNCHIHWEEGAFNHSVTGVELDEIHQEVSCGDCHHDRDFARKPDCQGCHDEPMYPQKLPGKRLR